MYTFSHIGILMCILCEYIVQWSLISVKRTTVISMQTGNLVSSVKLLNHSVHACISSMIVTYPAHYQVIIVIGLLVRMRCFKTEWFIKGWRLRLYWNNDWQKQLLTEHNAQSSQWRGEKERLRNILTMLLKAQSRNALWELGSSPKTSGIPLQ